MSTPTITPSDPQAMPLADLKTAAGLDGAQPVAAPEVPTVAAPPVTPEPLSLTQEGDTFVLKYATGEVFKGASETEAYRKAAENAVTNIQWAKQLKAERDAHLQTQPQTQVQPQTPEIDPQALITAQWARDQVDLADAHEMGVTVEQLRYSRRLALQGAPQTYLDAQATQFKTICKDWVETPDNLTAMHEYFNEYKGVPSAAELRMAWLDLKDAGRVVPLTAQPSNQPPAPRPPVMPSAGASGAGGDQSAWTMPLDQLKQQAGLG